MTAGEATMAVLEAWERADAAAVGALFSADGRYEDPLFPDAIVGPDAIREALGPAMAEVRDVRIPVASIAESGDTALCEARFLSQLADGEGRLDFDFAMVVVVRGGMIARLTEYFDTRGLQP
jgi:ketosteroid isomerase-like protein